MPTVPIWPLCGAQGLADLRPVERLFTGGPDISEAVYRLALAAREGRTTQEDMRIEPALDGRNEAALVPACGSRRWRSGDGDPATQWTVTDISRDREGQENVFQELQDAIDFLDHAPAGFMSVSSDANVPYLNATLAGWLDYDLARVGSGGLTLDEIAPPNAVAMIRAIRGTAGEVRTEVLDVDLKRRNGQSLPRAHPPSGRIRAGWSPPVPRARWCSTARAGGAGADSASAAEVRFSRFFHNTPDGHCRGCRRRPHPAGQCRTHPPGQQRARAGNHPRSDCRSGGARRQHDCGTCRQKRYRPRST